MKTGLALLTCVLVLGVSCPTGAQCPAGGYYAPAGGGAPSWTSSDYGIPNPGAGRTQLTGRFSPRPGRGATTPRPQGRTTPRMSPRSKKGSSTRFFYGAIKLPWQGAFLPKPASKGYEGRELDLTEAARGIGGDHAWKLKDRPTLVMVYDPASRNDLAVAGRIEERPDFVAAAQFFNLVRLDKGSITNKETRKPYEKGVRFTLFHADGTPAGTLKDPGSARKLLSAMTPIITKDYGSNGKKLLRQMLETLNRQAWLKKTLKMNEGRVICDCCSKKNKKVIATLVKMKRALTDLRRQKRDLLVRRTGDKKVVGAR